MKSIIYIITVALTLEAQANTWAPVFRCDNDLVVVDRSETTRDLYQMVLRGPIVDWLVNEAKIVPSKAVSLRGELIQEKYAHQRFNGHLQGYQFIIGTYPYFLLASIENFPPRLEAEIYSPKYGSRGTKHIYYLKNCNF